MLSSLSCRWEAEAKIDFHPLLRKPMVEQALEPVSQVNALSSYEEKSLQLDRDQEASRWISTNKW